MNLHHFYMFLHVCKQSWMSPLCQAKWIRVPNLPAAWHVSGIILAPASWMSSSTVVCKEVPRLVPCWPAVSCFRWSLPLGRFSHCSWCTSHLPWYLGTSSQLSWATCCSMDPLPTAMRTTPRQSHVGSQHWQPSNESSNCRSKRLAPAGKLLSCDYLEHV